VCVFNYTKTKVIFVVLFVHQLQVVQHLMILMLKMLLLLMVLKTYFQIILILVKEVNFLNGQEHIGQ
jgi:hypothetical protein